jgi:hypothetical protein
MYVFDTVHNEMKAVRRALPAPAGRSLDQSHMLAVAQLECIEKGGDYSPSIISRCGIWT